MDVANFSNPNEPSFVNTILSRGLYVGIMTIDNNKMDRIYTQLHIFGLGTSIIKNWKTTRICFLAANFYKNHAAYLLINIIFNDMHFFNER